MISLRSTYTRITFSCLILASATLSTNAQVLRTFTEPYERIDVSAAELGIVASVDVRLGEDVSKGQLLGKLNQRVLIESRRLAERRANSTARVDAARADLKLRESLYEKLKPLLQSGHANAAEVERAKAEFERAAASLQLAVDENEEAQIELSRIEAQLRQRQIVSPIDGTVIDIHRRPGEYLAANDPEFATVVDVSKLRSRFFVTTDFAKELRRGQPISLLIGTERKPVTAKIEFVSPITESESGTVRLDVLIDNKKSKWRSGIVSRLAAFSTDHTKPVAGRLKSFPSMLPSEKVR